MTVQSDLFSAVRFPYNLRENMRVFTDIVRGRSVLCIRSLSGLALCLVLLAGQPVAQDRVLRPVSPEEVQMDARQLAKIDRVIQDAIAAHETPGAVVLVARHGGIVYHKAFGKRAIEPAPGEMTLETIFDMASLTKVVATAASIMALIEDGLISLSDRVSTYMPEFAQHDKGVITLRDLLTHFSGLRPDIDLNDQWSGYQTAIERAFAEHLVAVPRKRFIYSDINFFILAELVRVVSGRTLEEFSRERIFEPLGMADTTFNPPLSRQARIAPTERRKGKMLHGQVHDPTASRMGGVAGHAGLFSTIGDSAIFAQMILNRGVYRGVRVLSPLSVEQMTRNQSPVGQASWRGLGFDIQTQFSSNRGDLYPIGSFGHTGFTGTSIWIDPLSDSFVLIFTSRLHPSGEGSVVSLRKKVASVAAAALLDLELPQQNGKKR